MIEALWHNKWAILMACGFAALIAFGLSRPSAEERCAEKGGRLMVTAVNPDGPVQYHRFPPKGPWTVCMVGDEAVQ